MAQDGEAGHREGPSATAEEVMPELKHETHTELGEGPPGQGHSEQARSLEGPPCKPPPTLGFCWSRGQVSRVNSIWGAASHREG